MKAAVVVCPGPSLDPSIIPALHEQADQVVACNRAYKAWDRYNLQPHALYLMDGPHSFADCKQEIARLTCPIFTPADADKPAKWRQVNAVAPVSGLPIDDDKTVEKDPFANTTLTRPLKTALVAWQHLVRQGYQLIGIAGCDGRIDPQRRYFFDSPPLNENKTRKQFRSYGQVIECLKHWQPYAEAWGTTTVNLSGADSALCNIMQSINPTEISKWLSNQ